MLQAHGMQALDWIILGVATLALGVFSLYSARHLKGVADFLTANRMGGRYLLTIAGGMSGIGAISAVAVFEMYYQAGFVPAWWGLMSIPLGVIILMTGYVYYRFRETRAMTMAQFFEMRYSKAFRIYAGIVTWVSGVVNFGIFPIVEARFFIWFCGLPSHYVPILGFNIDITAAVVMLITIGISVLFAVLGGQITVMATDCAQGIFCMFAYLFIVVFLLNHFGWHRIAEGLRIAPQATVVDTAHRTAQSNEERAARIIAAAEAKLAKARKAAEGKSARAVRKLAEAERALEVARSEAQTLRDTAAAELAKVQDPEYVRTASKGHSMVNPYDTSRVQDFNIWYFLIGIFGTLYGYMSWQGSAAYQSSGISPHEQKMGGIIAGWRGMVQNLMLFLIPICAFAFMHLPEYSAEAQQVETTLQQIPGAAVQNQMRVPVALALLLPAGLKGLFATVMLFFLITTQDTYMHSWGAMFIQDVVLPFRKTPFTPKRQILFLRLSVLGVAAFAFVFGLLFRQTEYILMFFAITGAIVSGAGACIVLGIYWPRGTPAAAFTSMTLGWVMALGRIVLQQIGPLFAHVAPRGFWLRAMDGINGVNSQVVWFYIMCTCLTSYVIVSLLTKNEEGFSLERILHRGKYAIAGEHVHHKETKRGLFARIVNVTDEFTLSDKILAYALIIWQAMWFSTFILGTLYSLIFGGFSDAGWTRFWKFWIWLQIIIGVPATIWFTIGGTMDLRRMFRMLQTGERNAADDGRVVHHHLAGEADDPNGNSAPKA